ncbi:MAG: four helix bundle protein [Bacteroidetes bacterium]|nr:four helix bundle protein [Bacteroidota bacterium]
MNPKEYLLKNKNINRGYRNLEVWNEAVDLYSFVSNNVLGKIDTVSFKVKAQIEDSIFSVSSNIAEGYCRRSLKENIQFVNIALASLGENYSQIFTLFNNHKITEDTFSEFDKKHYCLENKLISFNKSMIEKLANNETWRNNYIVKEMIEQYSSNNE